MQTSLDWSSLTILTNGNSLEGHKTSTQADRLKLSAENEQQHKNKYHFALC